MKNPYSIRYEVEVLIFADDESDAYDKFYEQLGEIADPIGLTNGDIVSIQKEYDINPFRIN